MDSEPHADLGRVVAQRPQESEVTARGQVDLQWTRADSFVRIQSPSAGVTLAWWFAASALISRISCGAGGSLSAACRRTRAFTDLLVRNPRT